MNTLEKNYRELLHSYKIFMERYYKQNENPQQFSILHTTYHKHSNYLNKIEKTKNLLENKSIDEKIDPIEEKYEFLKHIIDGFTVTDSEGTLIESLNRCCLLTSQGEVLMDYYDMKGVVESVGRDVTIHATIDELLDFFKDNKIS